MRFKSDEVGGYRVYAVSGTNTVSFAIDAKPDVTKGLLGFAVERVDTAEKERYYMYGFKVFKSVVPHPTEDIKVSTFDQPVQSFVWDDFTAKPGRDYQYIFHPLKGAPKNIDRSAAPVPIKIKTEPLYVDNGTRGVFFNRGVASSQAYAREFQNQQPDKITPPEKQKQAFAWLGRDLPDAILKFIGDVPKGDSLHCCFYEFRYLPVAQALAAAIRRGVDVHIIVDAKQNGKPAKGKSKATPAFPRTDNLQTIKDAKLPKQAIILRQAKPNNIAHNKSMVHSTGKGDHAKAVEVWTGSTTFRKAASSARPMSDIGCAMRPSRKNTARIGTSSARTPAPRRATRTQKPATRNSATPSNTSSLCRPIRQRLRQA